MASASLTAAERIAHVEALIEALNRGDLSAYFARTTRDFEITIHARDGGRAVVAGRRALRLFFDEFLERWEGLSYEFLEGPREVDGFVLTRDRWTGKSKSGDADLDTEYFSVGSFRDGLCARMDAFMTRDAANRHLAHLRGVGPATSRGS